MNTVKVITKVVTISDDGTETVLATTEREVDHDTFVNALTGMANQPVPIIFPGPTQATDATQ